jgi:lipid-A-disaccharide synthase
MSRAANFKAKGDLFDRAFDAAGGKQLASLKVVEENHALLSACDLALVKSGTVTLEATLYHTPMVVMYKGPWYTYLLARAMMTVKHISLPNNLAGSRLVPELWQYEANPTRIAEATERLLEPAAHAKMKRDLATLASTFANVQTPERVAEAIVRLAEADEQPLASSRSSISSSAKAQAADGD